MTCNTVNQGCATSYIFFRVYSDEARHDLELLKSSWLIDEFQQNLKSVANYREALFHLLDKAPELEGYLKQFCVVLTGDFPTWKYNKKIIAEVCCNHTYMYEIAPNPYKKNTNGMTITTTWDYSCKLHVTPKTA